MDLEEVRAPAPRQHDHHDELIPLTAGELRRMLTITIQPRHPDDHYQRRQLLHLRLLLQY